MESLSPRFLLTEPSLATPFVVGPMDRLASLDEAGVRLRKVDAFAEESVPFCQAFQRANSVAYDGLPRPATHGRGLGMPSWVFVDCCMLPSVAIGFEVPRRAVPEPLADLLDPEEACETLPVSEYIAVPALEPGVVIGVSFFSLVSGMRLGERTKALALRMLGAETLVGITQLDNPAMRVHLSFGPLEVVAPAVPLHPLRETTFVYRTRLGAAMSRDPISGTPQWLDLRDPNPCATLAEWTSRGRVAVVGTGPVQKGRIRGLHLMVDVE